jgi:hypothetical protein
LSKHSFDPAREDALEFVGAEVEATEIVRARAFEAARRAVEVGILDRACVSSQ